MLVFKAQMTVRCLNERTGSVNKLVDDVGCTTVIPTTDVGRNPCTEGSIGGCRAPLVAAADQEVGYDRSDLVADSELGRGDRVLDAAVYRDGEYGYGKAVVLY